MSHLFGVGEACDGLHGVGVKDDRLLQLLVHLDDALDAINLPQNMTSGGQLAIVSGTVEAVAAVVGKTPNTCLFVVMDVRPHPHGNLDRLGPLPRQEDLLLRHFDRPWRPQNAARATALSSMCDWPFRWDGR